MFGAPSTSSVTVNSPQLVWKVTVLVFAGSSFSVGFLAPPSGFGAGASTFAHSWPLSAAVFVVSELPLAPLLSESSSPQPAKARTVSRAVSAVSARIPGGSLTRQ